MRRPIYDPVGRTDRRVGFGEEHVEGLEIWVQPRFEHVLPIVGPLAEDAARCGNWGKQAPCIGSGGSRGAAGAPPIVFTMFDQRRGRRIFAGQGNDAISLHDGPARTVLGIVARKIDGHSLCSSWSLCVTCSGFLPIGPDKAEGDFAGLLGWHADSAQNARDDEWRVL